MEEALKTVEQLTSELTEMCQKVAELEAELARRKSEEAALRESETRYRELFSNMSSGVAVYEVREDGGDFIFKDFNRAGEALDGQNKEELLGKSIFEMRPGVEKFGLIDVFRRVWKTGTPMHHPIKLYEDERLSGWYENFVYKLPSGEIVAIFDNISAQKQAEQALRESEEKFRSYVEHAPHGIFVADEYGRYLEVNYAAERITGYSRSELLKMALIDLIRPEDHHKAEEHLHTVAMAGKARGELAFFKKDGGLRYLSVDAVKLSESRFLEFVTDITERIQAEEALRESEERWQFALEGSGDGVWDWNAQTNYVFFSRQWKTMFGFEEHEIGNSLEEWATRVHPEDRDSVYAEIRKHFAGYTPIYMSEHRVQCKDGTYKWILDRGKVIRWTEDKKPLRVIGTHTDITPRKQMEDALRKNEKELKTLFSAMTEMVVLHEMIYNEQGAPVDYRITDCNPTFSAITGISQEAAVGRLATKVYQTERAPYLEEYNRVARTGEPYEFTVYYPPMDKYFMISAVSPQKGQFATITTDITAMKQIQNMISAKNKELENYLYVASHDLRAPLVNIQGFSQRLQKQTNAIKTLLAGHLSEDGKTQQKLEQLTDEDIPRTLDFIFTNVSKMDTLINGLLKISRTGRFKMSIQKINMNALIEKIVRAFSFQLEDAGAKIVSENLPECYGDVDLLDQLFSNVISNALKYRSPDRQLGITLHAQTKYKKVLYSIRDTGIGIAQRHLEKIWDVFYRVDPQAPEAGEGIGLSIVKRIVDKHKGRIWVESDAGKGSVFYVELPGTDFSE